MMITDANHPFVHDENRIAGALYGLLIGDALGVPFEFHTPEQIPSLAALDYVPPAGFDRAHKGVPPGTWSDDGAQALCLLASLLDCGRLDLADFASRLIRWHDAGYLAVDGVVFDVGITTSQSVHALRSGFAPEASGSDHEHSNGNGSLMRVMPLVLWHRGDDASLVRDARAQSLVTHGHLRSQLCCALYCLWARRLLERKDDPWEDAVRTLYRIVEHESSAIAELEVSIRPRDPAIGEGTGYVVDSLHSARWAVEAPDFADAMRRSIRLGYDTDTTACIAGGIAGLMHGFDAIPQTWREGLRGSDLMRPLLDRLLDERCRE